MGVNARLEGVDYSYPASARPALSDVTLELGQGLTAIAGPSGGGKSTLLRLFNGLVPQFHGGRISGAVEVLGLDALRTPTAELARQVGFVFQDPEAQFVRASVVREVAFALENVGTPPAAIRDAVDWALGAAGIEHLAGRSVAQLSGGERQRVAVASGLALRPRLLVLDEPTSQLDPAGAAALWLTVRGLCDQGIAVVASEHRLENLLEHADVVGVVERGVLRAPGRLDGLAEGLPDPPAVVELARALGWPNVAEGPADASRRNQLRRVPPAPRTSVTGEPAWTIQDAVVHVASAPVLRQVTATGFAGEICAVMGPNGSGKTTLLRTIAGLQRLAAGRSWRRAGRVAYLPQDPGSLLHRRSVAEEVSHTLRRSHSDEAPGRMLDALGIAPLADRYPGDLSSGQRQRAALAVILAGGPRLVLLDEPTRGMDRFSRGALTELLREMAADGASVVVATHDPDLAAAVADRVLVVDAGGIVDAGHPRRALSGDSPYATGVGRLYPGAVTVEEALACL
ncbi:MAG: ABC transporter ATP-binding protein [Candidatus Dormibacteria bacterium]